MITEWQMYWLLMLDGICNACTALWVASAITVGLTLIYSAMAFSDDEDEIGKKAFRFTRYPVITFLLFGALNIFIPNTKQMAVIIITPKVVNAIAGNEEVKKLPDNLVSLANAWIEEFKPDEKHNPSSK